MNDRDGLTDLSLLHFACKSGAAGVGNIGAAVNLVNSLLNKVCLGVNLKFKNWPKFNYTYSTYVVEGDMKNI